MAAASVFAAFVVVVPSAAMLAAFAVVMVAVVAAQNIWIKAEASAQERLHGLIRIAGYAAVERDPGFLQSPARTAADSAADQRIHMDLFQNIGQGAMAAAVGIDHCGKRHFAVLHVINLEALRMPEVLKNLSVFISYRDSHF